METTENTGIFDIKTQSFSVFPLPESSGLQYAGLQCCFLASSGTEVTLKGTVGYAEIPF